MDGNFYILTSIARAAGMYGLETKTYGCKRYRIECSFSGRSSAVRHVHTELLAWTSGNGYALSEMIADGAQVVVTSVEDGKVVGVVAECDGTYRVDGLRAGHYEIVEGGPHNAVRKLSASEGQDSRFGPWLRKLFWSISIFDEHWIRTAQLPSDR